jgi:hypothetical protein
MFRRQHDLTLEHDSTVIRRAGYGQVVRGLIDTPALAGQDA